MDVSILLDEWKRTPEFMAQVSSWRVLPALLPRFADIPESVVPEVRRALVNRGIQRLYSHQREAYDVVSNGQDIVVVTPTASGKTLCYNLPVLNAVANNPSARALYLFPTKALSQDQVAELNDLVSHLSTNVQSYTYDGDTPMHARQRIREAGHIVVTNPDMLHAAILPHHTKWIRLFENLQTIVIDEAHIYRGVFGSHVANVIRRLLRICAFYGSTPRFILSSATIANPGDLAHQLTGRQTVVIDQSGAPQGEKHVIVYNPPIVQVQLGLRKSSLQVARSFATRLLAAGIPTISFVKTRTQVEVLTGYVKSGLPERLRDRVMGYRGGYLPNERRAIERNLRNGEIIGVVSTNALELGVDIGSLQAEITVGYPGSIASVRQQSGRAGRRSGVSLAMFIANASAIDQYIVHHPEVLLDASPEAARVYPENLLILMDHLKCAAYELPFASGESFGVETTQELLEYLVEGRILNRSGDGKFYWMSDALPSQSVSLRSAAQDNVVIIDAQTAKPQVIGETDRFSALTTLHEEAIYIHQSKMYQVETLDLENGKAYVKPVAVDYYTDAELAVRLRVLDVLEELHVTAGATSGGIACTHRLGEIMVNATPTLFKKIKLETNENLGWGKIHLPEAELHTVGYWCSWQRETFPLAKAEWESALLGAVQVLRHAAALHCMCSVTDLHIATEIRDLLHGQPTLYVYDAYPGGIGLAERVFRDLRQVYETAYEMIQRCSCESGCPSCVGPAGADLRTKQLAARLLNSILSQPERAGETG